MVAMDRRKFLRHSLEAAGAATLTVILAEPVAAKTPQATAINWQHEWRWCNKCESLYFGGHHDSNAFHHWGVCPAGGEHDGSESGDYFLVQNTSGYPGQHLWRWC